MLFFLFIKLFYPMQATFKASRLQWPMNSETINKNKEIVTRATRGRH